MPKVIKLPQSLKNTLFHLPLAIISQIFFGFPAKKLVVIGVTGSDGKTTTTHLIHHILLKHGLKTGIISTVNSPGAHSTTPHAPLLGRLLREMVQEGLTHVVIEATSHALDQHRLWGIDFAVAVHTNITHEHLDYHKTYAKYVQVKSKLFSHTHWAVLNKDDSHYQLLKAYIPRSVKIISYSLSEKAVLRASHIETRLDKSDFTTQWGTARVKMSLPLPGRYNVQNALAAIGAAGALGIKMRDAASYLTDFQPIVGRLNKVNSNPTVFIDFAHTPNALEKILRLLKQNLPTSASLICVFGCTGERDKAKRPLMGKISTRLANISIFTSDDTYREDVNEIINQMVSGAKKSGAKEITSSKEDFKPPVYIRQPQRQEAINLALNLAKPNDIILIAGKGHEKTINLGGKDYPWSDFEAVKIALGK